MIRLYLFIAILHIRPLSASDLSFDTCFQTCTTNYTLVNQSNINNTQKKLELEKLVTVDQSRVERLYGKYLELLKLKSYLLPQTYQNEIRQLQRELSVVAEAKIANEADMNYLFSFFITEGGVSKSKQISGLLNVTNILLILGSVVIAIAVISIFAQHIIPLIVKNISFFAQLGLLYFLTLLTLIYAHNQDESIAPYLGLLGSIFFGATFTYQIKDSQSDSPSGYFLLLGSVWSIIAIIFQSQLIGFIAVAAMKTFTGFIMPIGPLAQGFGFEDSISMMRGLVSSAFSLTVYIILELVFNEGFPYYLKPFRVGILSLSCLVYFTSLLIFSSKYYPSQSKIFFNLLFIASSMACFALGNMTANLSIMRGVSLFFSIFYTLQKWIEIPWKDLWSIGLLGFGLLIYGICVFTKNHLEYFLFEN